MGRFSKLETGKPAGDPSAPRRADVFERVMKYPDAASLPELADLDADAYMRVGDQALFAGKLKLALRWYSRAMDKDSTQLKPWLALIRTLLLKGDLSEATTWITRGLTLFPEDPKLLALRAVQYARRGLVREAIASSDAVLERNGAEPLAHLARGEVLLLADNKNADYCFEQCLKLTRADDWQTPFVIALIFEERRMWAKAIQYYASAAERNERCAVLYYRVGLCRARLGHRQQALRAFEQARELCPPDDPLLGLIEHASPGSIWRRLLNLFHRA